MYTNVMNLTCICWAMRVFVTPRMGKSDIKSLRDLVI